MKKIKYQQISGMDLPYDGKELEEWKIGMLFLILC